jgi:hypothetical protein
MATADDETKALTAPAGPLRRTWEKIATVLALIGLIDLTGQLIKWAGLIHWLAEKYAGVRAWLFSWLPFHIPPEWHDTIVLVLILFSVTNVGTYQSTGYTFIGLTRYLIKGLRVESIEERRYYIFVVAVFITALIVVLFLQDYDHIVFILLAFVSPLLISLLFGLIATGFHWLLATAAIFGALIAINYAYVQWLEPLAEHH